MEEENFKLIEAVREYINTPEFFDKLTVTLDSVKKEETKFKLMLDLINYVYPKMKPSEEDTTDTVDTVHIEFVEAKPDGEENT